MRVKNLIVLALFMLFFLTSQSSALTSGFGTGIGLNGTSTMNISAETPGPLKYHLEFKPLGGSRQISESTYSDSSKNFSTSVNVKCLPGGSCSTDETYVRGVYIVGEDNGPAVAKRFTLFCGSIQVVSEEKTDSWDDAYYKKVSDEFLNNGPSSGNCPSPTVTPGGASVTPTGSLTTTPVAKTTRKPTPTEDPEPTEEVTESPTPTPEEEASTAGFSENAPALIAGLVLLGVMLMVLYKTNPKFRGFVQSRFKKKDIPKITPGEPPQTGS